MKKIKFILILLLSIVIWSCDDDDADIDIFPSEIIENNVNLNIPEIIDFEVLETTDDIDGNEKEIATNFSWSSVKGSYNGTILYYLQIDVKGNNFRNNALLPLGGSGTTDLTQEVSFGDLNLAINQINTELVNAGSALAIDFTKANEFEVRILSVADVSQDKVFSEPITINVMGYEEIVVIEPSLFIVGDVQSFYGTSNWSPENGLKMRYIGDGTTKVFEAYLRGKAGNIFKLISNQAVWDDVVGNYGVIGGVQDGNLMNGSDSGNIEIPEDGQYYVQVDIDNLTYKFVKMQWGIIGSATPGAWDNETDMTYDVNSNSWSITTDLVSGELKFRSKNTGAEIYGGDWEFNCGPDLVAWDMPGTPNFTVPTGSASISIVIDLTGNVVATGV